MISKQVAIESKFGDESTAAEVMGNRRLDGKVAIVTGGYVGLGLETTRALASAGADVIVPVRPGSEEKALTALTGIPRITTGTLELSAPASVDAFAKTVERPVHYLFNNAGVMAIPFAKNSAGFELQLATNHLGHFQLTARLWPRLKAAGDATVVSLTSRGHAFANVDLEDPNFEHRAYDKWKAYGHSKTSNALFALALARRGVHAVSVHPGAVATDLARYVPEEELTAMRVKNPRKYKTPAQGASTSIWAAFAEINGVYCEDCNVANPVPGDSTATYGIRPWAMDADLADQLWKRTELWTGVRFDV